MMDIDFDDAGGEHLQAAASASASASAGPSSSTATRTAALHRIRFVDYSPSPITSIALTPCTYDPAVHYPYLPSIDSLQGREILAVGRQNGDIEIYTWIGGMGGQKQPTATKGKKRTEHAKGNRQGWVLERKLASPRPSRVEHLLFTHQVILSDSDKDLFDDAEQARELSKLRRNRPRLFSSGGGSDLWEWDWADGGLGYVKRTISSQGGAIWSMAANPTHTTLALGCDDGAVRLLDLWDGELEHVRKFDAVKTRLLSLAWGKRTPVPTTKGNSASSTKGKQAANTNNDDDGMDGDASDAASAEADEEEEAAEAEARYEDSLLVTGCADSTVRVWDARSGRCVHRMTTDKVKGEHTLVWCVALFGDGTAVSGDSMGNVKFWDTRMGTQLQSCSASRADILCLALGPDGRTVYASGVDQKTTQIQLLDVEASRTGAHANAHGKRAQKQTQTQRRWVISTSKRMHSHDVRALAVSPAYTVSPTVTSASSSSKVPVVISGGLDFSLIYSPAATLPAHARLPNPVSESSTTLFSESFQRKSAYIPQRGLPAHLAGEGRLVVCRKESGQVDVWALPQTQHQAARAQAGGSAGAGTDGWSKVLEMELSGKTNLVASAISPDGRWLAVSDLSETKVFRLRQAADGAYRARRCHDVTAALTSQSALERDLGASQLHFTSDSSRLVLATAIGARIVVVSLPESSHEEASVLRVFNQHRLGSRRNTGRAVAGLPAQQANGDGGEAGSDSESSDDEDAEDDVISSIACLATSSDGQWLVSADSACRLHVFNLDSLQYHSPLPSLELPPSALAFSPSAPSILAVGLPNNTLQFFDVEKRSIPSWAKGISQAPSGALTTLREPMLGLAFDPTPALGAQREDTLLTYGATWLCKMKIPSASGAASSKRRRAGAEEESDEDEEEEEENQPALLGRYKKTPVVVSHKYQPILLLEFTADGELVIVERPFFDLLGDMAPAFVERKYAS